MTRPFVSILIDTYNHEKFIEQAIVSVLEQDFPASDREILVVDDGSADRTPEILKKFEPQVRLLPKQNGGQASAFNLGIPQCRGELVAFLDGDDWWAPDKLARVCAALAADPSVGIVGHGIVNVQRDGTQQAETLREGFLFRANSREGALLFRRRGAFLGTSRMTIRTELLRRIGPVPEAIAIQADEFLFTLASAMSNVRILPESLTYYRLHAENLFQIGSRDPQKMQRIQSSLAMLANTLYDRIVSLGIAPEIANAVVEYTRVVAGRLRLQLDGGWPWETAKTEWALYRILHPEAPISHRVFKRMILLAALLVPPKVFYGAQSAVAQSSLYQRVRTRVLPAPEMEHIQRDGRAQS